VRHLAQKRQRAALREQAVVNKRTGRVLALLGGAAFCAQADASLIQTSQQTGGKEWTANSGAPRAR